MLIFSEFPALVYMGPILNTGSGNPLNTITGLRTIEEPKSQIKTGWLHFGSEKSRHKKK